MFTASNNKRSLETDCGYLKSKSGTGAQVKWDKSDQCVYWNRHYIGGSFAQLAENEIMIFSVSVAAGAGC